MPSFPVRRGAALLLFYTQRAGFGCRPSTVVPPRPLIVFFVRWLCGTLRLRLRVFRPNANGQEANIPAPSTDRHAVQESIDNGVAVAIDLDAAFADLKPLAKPPCFPSLDPGDMREWFCLFHGI